MTDPTTSPILDFDAADMEAMKSSLRGTEYDAAFEIAIEAQAQAAVAKELESFLLYLVRTWDMDGILVDRLKRLGEEYLANRPHPPTATEYHRTRAEAAEAKLAKVRAYIEKYVVGITQYDLERILNDPD